MTEAGCEHLVLDPLPEDAEQAAHRWHISWLRDPYAG
jgi:hypothetical protein